MYFSLKLLLILGFFNLSIAFVQTHPASYEFNESNVRVKRQDGYVYDKPNIAFDLPTRSVTVSTQAPTVDRTQQMFYAYPVPVGGQNTVNIGHTGTSSTTATTTSGTAGYNYGPQQSLVTGGTQNLAPIKDTQVQNAVKVRPQNLEIVGAQTTSKSGTQITSSDSLGYNYSPIQTTVISVPTGAVMNAPKYLPPSGSINIGVNAGSTAVIPSISIQPPSETITQTSTKAPVVSAVNTGYLPPNPAPTSLTTTFPNPSSLPTPTTNYLPPVSTARAPSPLPPAPGPTSTPAPTYLPPVF